MKRKEKKQKWDKIHELSSKIKELEEKLAYTFSLDYRRFRETENRLEKLRRQEGKLLKDVYSSRWTGWYWVKWSVVLSLKAGLDGVFIWAGPVQLIFNRALLNNDTQVAGALICSLIALFCIVDLIATLVFPVTGGGRDLPVWLEYGSSWRHYKEHWPYSSFS